MDLKAEFEKIAACQGWSQDTMLGLALDFIQEAGQRIDVKFIKKMEAIANEENTESD
jgi:hypothetical protein